MTALVPALTKPRSARSLRSTETVLDNGLRVIAIRKPGVPIVEVRLRLPREARPGQPDPEPGPEEGTP